MFVLFTPGNQRSSLKPKAITGFRCGCHGLHADTGRFGRGAQQLDRGDRLCSKGGGRLCQVCQVKTELCFLLDCPSYSHIRDRHSDPFTHSSKFLKTADPAQYLRKWFFHRHFVLPDLDLASNFQGWRQLPRIIFPRRTAFDAAARLAWLESAPSHICFA